MAEGFDGVDLGGGACGQGLVGGETDCAFAYCEAGEVGAEFVDDEVARGEEAAMIFEGGDGDDAV